MNASSANAPRPVSGLRPKDTEAITRGVVRYAIDRGFAPVAELSLANGRRADVAALDGGGEIHLFEVKSCLQDFAADQKWTEYAPFCDRFYFAVGVDFPKDVLPEHVGLLVADRFGASLLREAPCARLSAARRKAMLIRIARQAAFAAMGARADPFL